MRVVLARLHRDRALPIHRRRVQQHVQVVRRINGEPFANRRFQIGMPRLEVRADGIAPPPHFVPRVRRHVVDMARARDRLAEKFGARGGTLGDDRRLGGVHVQMTRARMIDVLRKNALEDAVQALHARAGDVAGSTPRLEQEQRIGVQRLSIEIVGVGIGDAAHRLGVRLVLIHSLFRIEFLDVADRHRVDERALFRGRMLFLQRERLPDGGVRVRSLVGAHRSVQVGSPCPRLAPVADGAVRVPLPRFAKRANRFGLGEGIHHLEALVEEGLRLLIRRGYRVGESTEPVLENVDGLCVALEHGLRRRLGALLLRMGQRRR